MRKSIGAKALTMVGGLGFLLVLIVYLNLAALQTISDQQKHITDDIHQYEEMVAAGDLSSLAALDEDMEYWIGKNDTKISGTVIFDIILLVAGVLGVILSLVAANLSLAKPAKKAGTQLEEIVDGINHDKGDLTARIEIQSKDEIGRLAEGINGFLEALQGLMQKLQTESSNMSDAAEVVMNQVEESNRTALNVSSATEELAASVQEVSAT